ncbi:lamin tail domain-containing protein [Actinoplanes aureus]|uniref:lamin tail domain-containing protein n=1 Tax=Actinoplanes aureus TaxID=2792083 RepID=UPI002814C83B|nr:lamin tail domain-containing protein [Actinoplanes aureus]
MLIAGTGLTGTTPAFAADVPTFNKPTVPTGFATVQLTGKATPNKPVTLHERAYIWRGDAKTGADLPVADEYDHPVTVTADASGNWTISRDMDSGFVWAVEAEDEYSPIVTAPMKVGGTLEVTSTAANAISYRYHASPDQPWFPVKIERQNGSSWVEVASGYTDGPKGKESDVLPEGDDGDKDAEFQGTATGQPAGQQTYRAVVAEAGKPAYASEENLIEANTFTDNVTVAGTGGGTPTSPSPSPSKPTTPTSPTPKPTTPTPKPTVPTVPAAPAVGSVQFTRIQYNAPGADRKTNKSINGEYFRITNKTKKVINLFGWTIRDRAGNLYRFTSNYYLAAGNSTIVRTGKGSNVRTNRYWGKTKHVWNNGGDTATLRTPANKTIDTCRWTKPGKGYTTC